MISQPVGLGRERRSLSAPELALVGEVALLLDGGRDLDGLDAALMCLRARTAADACEMFLATPEGQEMVLVSHQGADPDAFCQRDRFRIGEGFPGIVLNTGAVLSTAMLQSEGDFLRSRVKALGYTSAVCVPVRCGTEVGGCLFLAWKEAPVALLGPARAALLAALPLGAAVEAARTRARGLDRAGVADTASTLEARFRRLTSADEARLIVFGTGSRTERAGLPSEAAPRVANRCPARQSGRPQVLGVRSGWPQACIQSQCVCRARYCLPLKEGDDVWAVATVAFERQAPTPLTRRLPAALWLAEGVSPARSRLQPHDGTLPPEADPAVGTRLRIRCLGGFEVWVGDRLLRSSDFSRTKAYELLARLVLASGRPTTADELAGALWPRAETALLRNRFHVTLSALRGVIEPPSRHPRDWLHVRADGGRYYLDPHSPLYVDLWHFDALLRQAMLPGRQHRQGADFPALLDRAVRLYAGDAFEGAFDADWAQGAARHWRDRLLRALQRSDRSTPSWTPPASGCAAKV